jgi:4,5-DOPA dioxygenase extradiol
MLAIEPGLTGPALADWSHGRPKPSAVLVVSPHWSGYGLAVGTRERQQAWHDFGGFPPELYALQYSPAGSPSWAERVAGLLEGAGATVTRDAERPLDHGAWVPLRYLYPDADVPVVQLSLDAGADTAAQYRLGQALQPLRDEDVLIIGSGSMTHNLRDTQRDRTAPPLPYVRPFQQWYAQRLAAGDTPALLQWRQQAPGARNAHPHADHLMPLYVAWGAGEGSARRLTDEITYGALAMDAYEFGADPVRTSS